MRWPAGRFLRPSLAVLAVSVIRHASGRVPSMRCGDGRAPELSFFNSRFDVRGTCMSSAGGASRVAPTCRSTPQAMARAQVSGAHQPAAFRRTVLREKYGEEKWAEYRGRVRWRIIPRVY